MRGCHNNHQRLNQFYSPRCVKIVLGTITCLSYNLCECSNWKLFVAKVLQRNFLCKCYCHHSVPLGAQFLHIVCNPLF